MAPSPLPPPPLSALPASTSTYPPSSYPPMDYFESASVTHPAVLIPARRTGEIQKLLGPELLFQERKRKRVYPLEEGSDYAKEHLEGTGGYDPKGERKLVLARRGPGENDVADGDGDGDGDLLREAMKDEVWLDPRVKSLLESADEDSKTSPNGKRSIRPSYIQLPATPYSLLTVDQVLRRIMPTAENAAIDNNNNDDDNKKANPTVEEIPSSFEIAGHIAHLNLRTESLPYKYLIGRAILDKNRPKIKMVVNKLGAIENEFRTFPMEILAGKGFDVERAEAECAADSGAIIVSKINGEGDEKKGAATPSQPVGPEHRSLMEVEVREHGCRFKLDFARVYFNSRLQSEHARLVGRIVRDAAESDADECVVADAMAGVGPFAVPLTSANATHFREKTRIVCHANDLNPESYRYLRINARGNRCFSDRLVTYNEDARRFIRGMNEGRGGETAAPARQADHFIMNLPRTAPEFLDAFRGWRFGDDGRRPMVHVHCFGEKARSLEDVASVERQVRERCEDALGCPGCFSDSEGKNELQVHVVRDVGPRKNMLCVSFRLPREVEGVKKIELGDDGSSGDAGGADVALTKNVEKRDRAEGGCGGEVESHNSKRSKES